MDDALFSNILSVSMRMTNSAAISKLREASSEIINKINKADYGLHLIHGLRGVGKTTILADLSKNNTNSIYLSGDVILRYGATLLDVLHYAEKTGSKMFLIDEIHAAPQWEKDVKIFYDETHAKIVASGSSAAALKTKGSELSRRSTFFELRPLSFREYLSFKTGISLQKKTILEILEPAKKLETSKLLFPYLNEFEQYLKKHGLPVSFFENKAEAYVNIVERIVRYDLEMLREIDINYVEAAFKIIKFVASSNPGEVSYNKIANSINRSVKFTKEAVHLLSLAGLFYIVPPEGMGHKAIRNEDKILMPLSFRNVLCDSYGVQPSTGGLREDFFVQHVQNARYVKTGAERRTPDFAVGDYIFEIGGPSKGWNQLSDRKNAYLVKESTAVEKNEIPIYFFGLLY